MTQDNIQPEPDGRESDPFPVSGDRPDPDPPDVRRGSGNGLCGVVLAILFFGLVFAFLIFFAVCQMGVGSIGHP